MTDDTREGEEPTRYMLLNRGDVIQEGDEIWLDWRHEWEAVAVALRETVGHRVRENHWPIRRTLASAAQGVTVRALEWRTVAPATFVAGLGADRSEYTILPILDGTFRVYGMPGDSDGAAVYETLDLAKAAAQTDYERRILSALVIPPQAPAIAEGPNLPAWTQEGADWFLDVGGWRWTVSDDTDEDGPRFNAWHGEYNEPFNNLADAQRYIEDSVKDFWRALTRPAAKAGDR